MNRVFDFLAALLIRPLRPDGNASLAAINKARVVLGLNPVASLPKGQPGAIDACPLSQLLPGIIGATGISFNDQEDALRVAGAWNTAVEIGGRGRMVVVFPPILKSFVRDYDLGAFPSLVRKPSRRASRPTERTLDRAPIQRNRYSRPSDDRRAA